MKNHVHEITIPNVGPGGRDDPSRTGAEGTPQAWAGGFNHPAACGSFILDGNGLATEVDIPCARMFGFEPGSLLNRPIQAFVAPAFRDAFHRHLRKVFTYGKGTCNLQMVRGDGTEFPVMLEGRGVVEDALGKGRLCRFVMTDVTRRTVKEPGAFPGQPRPFFGPGATHEDPDQASKKQSHELNERVKELNCLFSISNIIEEPDTAWCELMQKTVDAIPPGWQYREIAAAKISLGGREFKTDNFRETHWKQHSDITVEGERAGMVEVFYLEERPVCDEGPFLAEERNLIDAIARHLGRLKERKDREEQFRQARKMEAIGVLAGGIAHDFNNILAGIIGFSEMVVENMPPESKERRRLDMVLKSAYRARSLVRQILAFSRQTEVEQKPVALTEIIEEGLRLLRPALPSTVAIVKKSSAVDDLVMADPVQMHEVLMNLCTNAAQSMREKGGVLQISLTNERLSGSSMPSGEVKPGDYVTLSISDTGCGMEPEVVERIFDPFFTTKSREEGTGIGLSVVHGIVKNHGGYVTVDSSPGEGSTFHVYLPAIKEHSDSRRGRTARMPRGRERILFVDDEEMLVALNKERLKSLGYRVVVCTSGMKALELFKAGPGRFDLVITDYTMPRLTGIDLARELLKIRPDIRIILSTGHLQGIPSKTLSEAGIREVLTKPLGKAEVAVAIRRVLDAGPGTPHSR
jgi:signal transduction histidine kinase/CheY-like chemotaxis protein